VRFMMIVLKPLIARKKGREGYAAVGSSVNNPFQKKKWNG